MQTLVCRQGDWVQWESCLRVRRCAGDRGASKCRWNMLAPVGTEHRSKANEKGEGAMWDFCEYVHDRVQDHMQCELLVTGHCS